MTRHTSPSVVLSLVLVLLVSLPSRLVAAWMTVHNHGLLNMPSSARQRQMTVGIRADVCLYGKVEAVSLQALDDHASEGQQLAKSIAAWLDAEWMPQDVHVQMGESAKQSYIESRELGEDDIMSVMMRVAGDLDKNWQQYDADAFVNAWDIANYVSDYLTKRSGSETCDCSSKIY